MCNLIKALDKYKFVRVPTLVTRIEDAMMQRETDIVMSSSLRLNSTPIHPVLVG